MTTRVELAIETLERTHPLRYGFTQSGTMLADDEIPKIAGIMRDTFARCPVCEQWSPCDVRILIAEYRHAKECQLSVDGDAVGGVG